MVVCANRLEDEGGRHEACNQHLYILSTTRPPLTLTVAVSRREAEQVRSSMDRTSPPTVNEICERLGVFDLYQLAGSSVEDE